MERLAEALQAVDLMLQRGFPISQHIIESLLQGCTEKKDLAASRHVHYLTSSSGLDSVPILGDYLIRVFAACRSILEANLVFCKVAKPSVYTWHAIILAHDMQGESDTAIKLYHKMLEEDIKPNKFLFPRVLKACGNMGALRQGMLIHEHIIRSGLDSGVVGRSTLIYMYAKCNNLEKAHRVFDKLQNRNVVSWNALMTGYVQNGYGHPALKLFEKMQLKGGINPNKVTFLCALKSCGLVGALGQAKLIHHQIIESGLSSDIVIRNTLIDMYSKFGRLKEANRVFNESLNLNIVSWGAMIAGYAQHGHGFFALQVLEKMQQEGVLPDKVTFLCILKACGSLQATEHGKLMHDQIVKTGLESDVVVGSALVDMYAKCWMLEEARKVFDELQNRNIASWGAIITGYAQHGQGFPALELYVKMQQEGIEPDKFMFPGILKACGNLGDMVQGKLVHDQIIKSQVEPDVIVGNTLVHMYFKCGNLEEACNVFNELPYTDVVSWGLMIAGYAKHGDCRLAGQFLKNMQQQGLDPDEMIFTHILSACSRAGHVEEGHQYFKSMKEGHGIAPSIKHFTCMVNLLGWAGCLKEAEHVLRTMPFPPNVFGLMSLLNACKRYCNLELGRHNFDQIIQLDPRNASGYTLMSKIYADANMWKDVHTVQVWRKCTGAWKKPGMACMEVNSIVHEFIVGDQTHPRSDRIYANLKRLRRLLEEEGYVPQLDLVELITEKNGADNALWWHSEKLAGDIGLLTKPEFTLSEITKKVCIDCLSANKSVLNINKLKFLKNDAKCPLC